MAYHKPPEATQLPPRLRAGWRALETALTWRYGERRAWSILMEDDPATLADLRRWRLLGRPGWPSRGPT